MKLTASVRIVMLPLMAAPAEIITLLLQMTFLTKGLCYRLLLSKIRKHELDGINCKLSVSSENCAVNGKIKQLTFEVLHLVKMDLFS